MNRKRLELVRRIVQIVTILVAVGFVPLAIFTPWSSERVIEDYGSFGSAYTVYHYNIYIALAFFLPVVGLLATNGSVKRYFKTHSVRYAFENRDQIEMCIICGQPNFYKRNHCTYCGNEMQKD